MGPVTLDLPILKEVFHKILSERRPYCVICFRTNEEVRLMTPDYIKRFMQATIMKTRVIDGAVCYICESKSKQALLMYRSTVFSNTIRLLLHELLRQNVTSNDDIFEKKFFKKIIKNVGLSPKLSAGDIQSEIQHIRTNSCLSQTNMVVTDSTQPILHRLKDYERNKSPNIAPPRVFNSPKPSNTVTSKDAASSSHVGTVNFPILAPRPSTGTSGKDTPSSSHMNKVPETVIIDDEDEQPDNTLNIIKTTLTATPVGIPTNLHILTQLLDHDDVQNVPKIITMADIQNKFNESINFLLHDIYITNDNKYTVPSLGADIINGTVIFYDSNKQIISKQPLAWCADFLKQNSLPGSVNEQNNKNTIDNHKMGDVNIANVKNNNLFLINNDIQSNDFINDSCEKDPLALNDTSDMLVLNSADTNQNKGLVVLNTGDGVLKRFMMMPEGISDVNSLIFNANANHNKMATGGTGNNNVHQNSNVVLNRKRKNKSDVPISPKVIVNNSKISGIVTPDINSDIDRSGSSNKTGTDWEDKIPMDVISFVDAVDPNADKMLRPAMGSSFGTIQISEPVSLAKKLPLGIDNDVIDLC